MGQAREPTQHGQRKTRSGRHEEKKFGPWRAHGQGSNMPGRAPSCSVEGASRSALRRGEGKSFSVEQAETGPSSSARCS